MGHYNDLFRSFCGKSPEKSRASGFGGVKKLPYGEFTSREHSGYLNGYMWFHFCLPKCCQSVAIYKNIFLIYFWYQKHYWYPCKIKSYVVYKPNGNFSLSQSLFHGKILEIWSSKKILPPPRGMFRIVLKNSVYEESCVLVFLNLCRNNYSHIIGGLFKIWVFVPFFG